MQILSCRKDIALENPGVMIPDHEIVGAWKLHYYDQPFFGRVFPHQDTIEYFLEFKNNSTGRRIIDQQFPVDTTFINNLTYYIGDTIINNDTISLLSIDGSPNAYQILNDTTLNFYSLLGTDPIRIYYKRYSGILP